jgi:hypothetical protein
VAFVLHALMRVGCKFARCYTTATQRNKRNGSSGDEALWVENSKMRALVYLIEVLILT